MNIRRRTLTASGLVLGVAVLTGCSSSTVVSQPAPTIVSAAGDMPTASHTWRFDEGTGTTSKDLAEGGGADMTLENGASWTAGVHGKALALQGQQDAEAELFGFDSTGSQSSFDTSGSYSVAAWVKMSDPNASFQTFVSVDPGSASGSDSDFFLQYAGAERMFAFSTAQARAIAPDVHPAANTWYYLTGVRDAQAGTMTLYVDGLLAGSAAVAGSSPPGSGAILVGRAVSGGGPSDWVTGAVDDVSLFPKALGARQIAALYNQERLG